MKRHAVAVLTAFLFASFPASAESQNAAAPDAAAGSSTLEFANGLYSRRMYQPAIAEYEKFIRTNPGSPEIASARFRRADSYYFTDDFEAAIREFETFLRESPADKRGPSAYFRIGSAHFRLKRFPEAQRAFRAAVRKTSDPGVRSGALYYLALSSKDAPSRGIGLYRRLVKSYPQSEYASYAAVALGDAYADKKNFDRALESYRLAAEKSNPIEVAYEARFKTAEIYFSQKDYTRARGSYERLFGDAAASPSTRELRDKALLGLFYCDYYGHDLGAAENRFKAQRETVQRSASAATMIYLLANLEEEAGKHDEALARLDEALAVPSADAEIRQNVLHKKAAILEAVGKKPEALATIETIFQSAPPNPARAYFEKAKTLDSMGRAPEALENYSAVIARYPDTDYAKAALYHSAVLKRKGGDAAGARADFESFAKKYGSDDHAGEAVLEVVQIDLDAKRFREAADGASAFLQAHAQSPLVDIAYYKLGVAQASLGDQAAAAKAFQKITESYPDSKVLPEALYGAALSLENSGNLKAAIALDERLVSLFPKHALGVQTLERLGFLYLKAGDETKTSALYQDILINRPDVKLDPEVVFWLVRHFIEDENYDAIQKVLPLLPARFPDRDFGHEINFFLGESFMGQKDYAKALSHYSEAVTLRPDGAYAAHAHLGMGLASATMGDRDAAEKQFSEALRFEGELKVGTRARFEMASLRLAAGNYEEAAKAFMLVAILYDDPKYSPLSLYKAAECFRKIGQPDNAEKAFAELRTRYPKSLWAKKVSARKEPANA
ncbi:MAG TPA: tetratricopeptide repeat protein [Candidatus Eisenbacteria bacterium]|nr:tetratricopeptide repeat protein [Candidatus Eisenbacteria bacterium]